MHKSFVFIEVSIGDLCKYLKRIAKKVLKNTFQREEKALFPLLVRAVKYCT